MIGRAFRIYRLYRLMMLLGLAGISLGSVYAFAGGTWSDLKDRAGALAGHVSLPYLADLTAGEPERYTPPLTQIQTSGCTRSHRAALPDSDCTPGATRAAVTKKEICRDARPGPTSISLRTRRRIRHAYGTRAGTLTRLIPARLGGSSQAANLYPLPDGYAAARAKVTRVLVARICAGRMSLRDAQKRMATDWRRP